jgi:hypothetical protein
VAALLSVLVRPATAGDLDGSTVTEVSATTTSTGIRIELTAWSDGRTVSVGSNPLAECTIVTDLDGPAAIDYAGGRGILVGITNPEMETSDATYAFVSCPERIFNGFNWAVWEQGDPPPPVVIDALAAAARAAIAIPPLTPQSAPDGIATPFLTQLPVWLWVPEASWVPVSGTASLAGLGLSVTATATPVSTDWVTGAEEGNALRCRAGTPWQPGLDDDATGCSATYGTTTPPGTTIDLSVTTTYDIAFACTPGLCDAAAINLPGFAVTVARPVTVTEARGVITR